MTDRPEPRRLVTLGQAARQAGLALVDLRAALREGRLATHRGLQQGHEVTLLDLDELALVFPSARGLEPEGPDLAARGIEVLPSRPVPTAATEVGPDPAERGVHPGGTLEDEAGPGAPLRGPGTELCDGDAPDPCDGQDEPAEAGEVRAAVEELRSRVRQARERSERLVEDLGLRERQLRKLLERVERDHVSRAELERLLGRERAELQEELGRVRRGRRTASWLAIAGLLLILVGLLRPDGERAGTVHASAPRGGPGGDAVEPAPTGADLQLPQPREADARSVAGDASDQDAAEPRAAEHGAAGPGAAGPEAAGPEAAGPEGSRPDAGDGGPAGEDLVPGAQGGSSARTSSVPAMGPDPQGESQAGSPDPLPGGAPGPQAGPQDPADEGPEVALGDLDELAPAESEGDGGSRPSSSPATILGPEAGRGNGPVEGAPERPTRALSDAPPCAWYAATRPGGDLAAVLGRCDGPWNPDERAVAGTHVHRGERYCLQHLAFARDLGGRLADQRDAARFAAGEGLPAPLVQLRVDRCASTLLRARLGGWVESGFEGGLPDDHRLTERVPGRWRVETWVRLPGQGPEAARRELTLELELGEGPYDDRLLDLQWR